MTSTGRSPTPRWIDTDEPTVGGRTTLSVTSQHGARPTVNQLSSADLETTSPDVDAKMTSPETSQYSAVHTCRVRQFAALRSLGDQFNSTIAASRALLPLAVLGRQPEPLTARVRRRIANCLQIELRYRFAVEIVPKQCRLVLL